MHDESLLQCNNFLHYLNNSNYQITPTTGSTITFWFKVTNFTNDQGIIDYSYININNWSGYLIYISNRRIFLYLYNNTNTKSFFTDTIDLSNINKQKSQKLKLILFV